MVLTPGTPVENVGIMKDFVKMLKPSLQTISTAPAPAPIQDTQDEQDDTQDKTFNPF